MLAKRIVAALDIRDGKVVKGIRFQNVRDVGDPVSQALAYEKQGVDEIVFLDITASHQGREINRDWVENVASVLRIPFTVGGGISRVEQMVQLVKRGADKVFLNTAALQNPELVRQGAQVLGSANLVVAIDARAESDGFRVYSHGGRVRQPQSLAQWSERVQQLGAGEILLTSMDTDGVREGFDLPLLQHVCQRVHIPVIASGGAGSMEHFAQVFAHTNSSAALAASVFHYGTIHIAELKQFLTRRGIHVRPTSKLEESC
ncbi:MAG TPA: imidazole glycerol phosphate synthase subunit HisF [Thermotogota bacterium]|nr:imidazole glycerol phosphate synthase subunit HisF [Thermotogota bacterium]HRW91532.1 imidazole glycerol phosphate synthase subunit HisF [Thermotogota bacterium]